MKESDEIKKNVLKQLKGEPVIGGNEAGVAVSPAYNKTDSAIAVAALNALKWHSMAPDEKIIIKVEGGIISLKGAVNWEYEKTAAKSSIEHLAGVRGVINFIKIRNRVIESDIRQRIEEAFNHQAFMEPHHVFVEIIGTKVILRGTVTTYEEKEAAYKAAWAAPGVTMLENRLDIEYQQPA